MDMVKMGSFLAELRKEQKLTQAELGEKLGVTNKTVSRWVILCQEKVQIKNDFFPSCQHT